MYQDSAKPLIGKKINWAHPLTKGLFCCLLFNEGGGFKAFELVNGVGCQVGGSPPAVFTRNGLTVGASADSYVDLIKIPKITDFGACFTIEIMYYWDTITNDKAFFSWDLSTSWKNCMVTNVATPSWFTRITTSTTLSSIATGTNVGFNHSVFVWDGAVKTVYRNGKYYTGGAPTHGAGIIYLAGCNYIRLGRAGDYTSQPQTIYLFRMWSRVLTPMEIYELYIKPYAMFERRPYWMDYTAPVGGTEYRPFYHNHYQQMRIV